MPPRILLLQARNHDDAARLEERQSFADKAGLDIEQIVPYELLSGTPTLREALGYDALMVGGAGTFTYRREICRDSRKSWNCCGESWRTVTRPSPLALVFNSWSRL